MNNPETLEGALKEMMRLIRKINVLQQEINENWGVRLTTTAIPGHIDNATGEVAVRRGLEEIEKALGKEAKKDDYFDMRKLRYQGIEFRQYADEKTKTFVKAFGQPPKVVIVEDDGEN